MDAVGQVLRQPKKYAEGLLPSPAPKVVTEEGCTLFYPSNSIR